MKWLLNIYASSVSPDMFLSPSLVHIFCELWLLLDTNDLIVLQISLWFVIFVIYQDLRSIFFFPFCKVYHKSFSASWSYSVEVSWFSSKFCGKFWPFHDRRSHSFCYMWFAISLHRFLQTFSYFCIWLSFEATFGKAVSIEVVTILWKSDGACLWLSNR